MRMRFCFIALSNPYCCVRAYLRAVLPWVTLLTADLGISASAVPPMAGPAQCCSKAVLGLSLRRVSKSIMREPISRTLVFGAVVMSVPSSSGAEFFPLVIGRRLPRGIRLPARLGQRARSGFGPARHGIPHPLIAGTHDCWSDKRTPAVIKPEVRAKWHRAEDDFRTT